MAVPYWDIVGSTMVTNHYIRLTASTQSRQGGLWNTVVRNLSVYLYIHYYHLFMYLFVYHTIGGVFVLQFCLYLSQMFLLQCLCLIANFLLFSLFQPLKARDWEVVLTFNVHGSTGDLHGDGFAFWYTKDRNQLGPVFGYKDYFQGLGIFLDTYSNQNGPHNVKHTVNYLFLLTLLLYGTLIVACFSINTLTYRPW